MQILRDWDAALSSESGELPTGRSIDHSVTSCVVRLRFSFFPHTVVCIRPVKALQHQAFAAVELASATWDSINTELDELLKKAAPADARKVQVLQKKRKAFMEARYVGERLH
jgi:hypothetical protein